MTQEIRPSIGRIRTGWVITGLLAAFFVFDVIGKLLKPTQVVEAFARTGWPIELSVTIGVILLACTVLYLLHRTAMLGSVLLTG